MFVDYTEDKHFFILSPKDIVLAQPRDIDDRLTWFLERKAYHEAYKIVVDAEKRGIMSKRSEHSVRAIGEWLLGHLMDDGKYEEAAKECVNILGDDKDAWERWIFSFAESQELKVMHLVL